MTLYLTAELTVEEIRKANANGIVGVKSYPRGVTTNSSGGVDVEDYSAYYPVFGEMESLGMVLNLHGEVPSGGDVSVLDAEKHFLPHLETLAHKFPKLRIVLEHCTTAAAIECVEKLPDNVAATITAHHLALIIDDVVGCGLNFCKPVAKLPADRKALHRAVSSGNKKFFLGSDSAPHPVHTKLPAWTGKAPACAAGVYTSPVLLPLLATLFEKEGIPLAKLNGFVSAHGRAFYKIGDRLGEPVKLVRKDHVVASEYQFSNGAVVPFMAAESLGWKVVL